MEINGSGKCITTISLNILLDTGQNLMEGGLISETLFKKFKLLKKELAKKKHHWNDIPDKTQSADIWSRETRQVGHTFVSA